MLKQAAHGAGKMPSAPSAPPRKLAEQLRQSEEQVSRLQSDLKQSQERAQRAENWLISIQKEIEETYSTHATTELQRLSQQQLATVDCRISVFDFLPASRSAVCD